MSREDSFLFYGEDVSQRGEPQPHKFYVSYTRVYHVPDRAYDIIPINGDAFPDLPETIYPREGVQIPRVLTTSWDRATHTDAIEVTVTWYQVRLYDEDLTSSPAELNYSRVTDSDMEWNNAARFFVSTTGASGISVGGIYPGDGASALDRRIAVSVSDRDTTTLPGMILHTIEYKGVRLTGTTIGNIGEIVKAPIYKEIGNRREISVFGVANASLEHPVRGSKYSADTALNLAARVLVNSEEDPYYLPGLFLYKLIYQGAIPLTVDSATYMEIKGSRAHSTNELMNNWTTQAIFADQSNATEEADSYGPDSSFVCQNTRQQMEWLPGINYQEATYGKYNPHT